MGRDDAFDIDDVRVVRIELMVPSFPKIYGISADLLPFSQAFDLFIWQCPSEKRYAVPFRGSKINHNFFPLPDFFLLHTRVWYYQSRSAFRLCNQVTLKWEREKTSRHKVKLAETKKGKNCPLGIQVNKWAPREWEEKTGKLLGNKTGKRTRRSFRELEHRRYTSWNKSDFVSGD